MVRSVKPRILIGSRDLCHVLRLRSLGAVCNFEFNFLTLDQGFITIARDSAVMDKNILLSGLLNKTISFGVVKPFNLTDCFRHHD